MSGSIGSAPGNNASFSVIARMRVRLEVGGAGEVRPSRTFTFELSDVAQSENVILMFNLANSARLDLQFTLNNLVFGQRHRRSPERAVHSVLAVPAVQSGQNELTILVREGSCTISDVVIWHRVFGPTQ